MIQTAADLAKLYTSLYGTKGSGDRPASKKESLSAFLEKLKEKKQAESLRKQAHHAVSLFYEMGNLSDSKARNGTSNGKNAAYGRNEPDISSSHTKVLFNQAVFSGHKIIPQTSKPGSDTNMTTGQSRADWTD